MAENKTKLTETSVEAYFSAIADDGRRQDCEALSKLIAKATKLKPAMWGTSIVGFGSYHYKYDSGREGDSCLTGFSSRKNDITVYLGEEVLAQQELVSKLGKHKASKGCLHIARLSDIDTKVMEKMVIAAVAAKRKRYG